MENKANFAGDLKQASALLEEAFMLLIQYRDRDGKPLTHQERMRFETFMGSVEAIRMLRGLLDVPVEFKM
jgi:hypothetical protein